MSRPRRNRTPPTSPSARPSAPPRRRGSLLPPKHILNAPTKLMKSRRLRRGLRLRPRRRGGLLRPGLLPRRARPPDSSTIRPSAASSARSGSAWTIGRSCARKRLGTDAATTDAWRAACQRGHGVVCARATEQFVGRWAVKPEICASHGGDTRRNLGAGRHRHLAVVVRRLLPDRQDVQGQGGLCAGALPGKGDVPVTLDAHGDRMRVTWSRAKPEEMQRCR